MTAGTNPVTAGTNWAAFNTAGTNWAAFVTDELSDWERIRRYAVPRRMIELATARRAAGDWRGACTAANIDVAFDVHAVAREHGAQVAERLSTDLLHLAPDLLRWHLPRALNGRTTLGPGLALVLADYDEPGEGGPGAGGPGAGGPGAARPGPAVLQVLTPIGVDGHQRLVLRFGDTGADEQRANPDARTTLDWTSARARWDVRRTGELLAACGGDGRAPFFQADGTPLTAAELPSAAPGPGDATALTEWVALLHQRGDLAAAFDVLGFDLPPSADGTPAEPPHELWGLLRKANLAVVAREAARLADLKGADSVQATFARRRRLIFETGSGTRRPRVRPLSGGPPHRDWPALADHHCARLPDLELLRAGRITPERLHPLVRAALFPGRPAAEGPVGPPGPEAPRSVRVRCQGRGWHEMRFRGGTLTMPHTDEERERELALLAFGGALSGCFGAHRAWTSGRGRLPKALLAQRRELFQRAQHGDTAGVLWLLDAGVDPSVRNGRRQTLLHLLHLVDHEELLPRLLKAGLGLEDLDHRACTPLHSAVGSRGSPALVRALLAAGARIDAVDDNGASINNMIHAFRRKDLDFLKERIDREHPGIGVEDWDYYDVDWEDDQE
ncbi:MULTISPECIES: ankyrin repeat domain-containing protein [Thermomonosporaceae]|uniref:ankyrin repeat domain-containing protein n=1 Tax=Thermomonosporaceae TaxID=2012 RepID=UPI00255AF7D0|nr:MULTISPECIES: ankyrin repeat domain-containing protein [Thermomonosporaceae]MDL4774364.1 ankyrin repeat domain-containing protein [Actinomadura xylanilytica]